MNINFKNITVIPANKENELHKKGVLKVFNENIEYFHLTEKLVSYEEHSKWWDNAFEDEYIYVILYKTKVCGYIRLTKRKTNSKEKYEISIALRKKIQKYGIGSYAYNLFENEMKKAGIPEIIAITVSKNILGQKFFEKNKFKKNLNRYKKIL
ncbi:MAG: GNAT family N-acetyltransferase [Promethearchaeota archaeon]